MKNSHSTGRLVVKDPKEIPTLVDLLRTCAEKKDIHEGERLRAQIREKGFLEKSTHLFTSLIDMYAELGILGKALEVHDELPIRDLDTWNALIRGYSRQGQGYEALKCFHRMQSDGISPDNITFLCVLSACGRSGLWEEAQLLYGDMDKKFGITPMPEHHSSVVVGLGFAGQFDKATSQIKKMPCPDYPAVWHVLLGSCRKWTNVKLGKLVFDQTIQLDNTCASAYVLMANIFAAAGMQEDAENIEAMRVKTKARAQKKVGKEHLG